MDIPKLLKSQRGFFTTGATRDIDYRLGALGLLADALERREGMLIDALGRDLGKSPMESYMTELGILRGEVALLRKNLRRWARPRRVPAPLAQFPAAGRVHPQPYGQVLVMAPWNYPVQLSLVPLAGALAAGNTVVLKPSEDAPHTAAALEQTPEMLPVLKKAGVVDAGGQGLLIIYQGMQSVFQGNGIVPSQETGAGGEGSIHPDADAAGELDLADLTYPYCTEFIILKEDKNADILKLRAYLESIGDSAVVVDDEDIIKCHVHTADPGKAIQKALQFGMLNKIKIDNMWIQHDIKKKAATAKAQNKVAVDPDQPHGFVSVAAGDGVKQLFLDLGVHQVVSGGQTMNPSTDDILRAAEATPCQTVYVLPNNKNIIMAAEQAAKLCKSRDIKVIPTRTIPQGLSAMLAFDEGRDPAGNVLEMTKAADRVGTGQITFAARDSDYDGYKIKEGELLGLENGKVSFTERDLKKAAVKLTKALLNKESSFVTVIYGEDISEEQAAELETAIREKLPDQVDLAFVNGGQPVYYLIISVE